MDLSSGYPFWLIKSGLPYDYPFLEQDLKTDVLILGGGISGALVAYKLIQAGVKCIIADSRSIGLGSTCSSTSLLQYEIDTALCDLIEKVGKPKAVEAYGLCSAAIDKLEIIAKAIHLEDFERKQSLYFAAGKKDIPFLKKEFAARKEAGFAVKYLNAGEIKKQYRFDSAGAILSEQGAQTNAYQFTQQLLQYCIKKNLKVYDRTECVKIKQVKNQVLLKTNKGYNIKANHLVYATGYESLKYIDQKYLKLKSTYAVCSEQMNKKQLDLLKDNLFWNTADPYLYMRLTKDNRILIGGRDDDFYDPKKREKRLPGKVKMLVKDFKKLFPKIPFDPEFSWAGTFGATDDGLPFIGKYKKEENSHFSLGFGGNGITFSLIGATIIADMITGRNNKYGHLFSFDRI